MYGLQVCNVDSMCPGRLILCTYMLSTSRHTSRWLLVGALAAATPPVAISAAVSHGPSYGGCGRQGRGSCCMRCMFVRWRARIQGYCNQPPVRHPCPGIFAFTYYATVCNKGPARPSHRAETGTCSGNGLFHLSIPWHSCQSATRRRADSEYLSRQGEFGPRS